MLPNSKTNKPYISDPQHSRQARTQVTEDLQLRNSPKLEDIPALCNKDIATIINKASRKLVNFLRKKTYYVTAIVTPYAILVRTE